jgi:hypothetical protein
MQRAHLAGFDPPLTHAKRGRVEPGTDLGHAALVIAGEKK